MVGRHGRKAIGALRVAGGVYDGVQYSFRSVLRSDVQCGRAWMLRPNDQAHLSGLLQALDVTQKPYGGPGPMQRLVRRHAIVASCAAPIDRDGSRAEISFQTSLHCRSTRSGVGWMRLLDGGSAYCSRRYDQHRATCQARPDLSDRRFVSDCVPKRSLNPLQQGVGDWIRHNLLVPVGGEPQIKPTDLSKTVGGCILCFGFVACSCFAIENRTDIGFPALVDSAEHVRLIQQQRVYLHVQTGLLQHLALHTVLLSLIGFDAAARKEPIAAASCMFSLLNQQDMIIADDRSLVACDASHSTFSMHTAP